VLAGLADNGRHLHELHGRLAVARDDDLFAILDGSDEFGEVGLGVMDVDFHRERLANLPS